MDRAGNVDSKVRVRNESEPGGHTDGFGPGSQQERGIYGKMARHKMF